MDRNGSKSHTEEMKLFGIIKECTKFYKINKKLWEELIAYFPWYHAGHIENDASNNSSIVACVFVTAVTFLPSRCPATMGVILPSRCLATMRGFLSSRCLATIRGVLPSSYLATIGGYTDIHTHRQQRAIISLIYSFKLRKVDWKLWYSKLTI
jgi:hypothetical protein